MWGSFLLILKYVLTNDYGEKRQIVTMGNYEGNNNMGSRILGNGIYHKYKSYYCNKSPSRKPWRNVYRFYDCPFLGNAHFIRD